MAIDTSCKLKPFGYLCVFKVVIAHTLSDIFTISYRSVITAPKISGPLDLVVFLKSIRHRVEVPSSHHSNENQRA